MEMPSIAMEEREKDKENTLSILPVNLEKSNTLNALFRSDYPRMPVSAVILLSSEGASKRAPTAWLDPVVLRLATKQKREKHPSNALVAGPTFLSWFLPLRHSQSSFLPFKTIHLYSTAPLPLAQQEAEPYSPLSTNNLPLQDHHHG
jgi:hypothetical protein